MVHMTAAHWHALVAGWECDPDAAKRRLKGVRLFNVTGDALSTRKLKVWDALRPDGLKVVNTYGPTETTVSCTAAYVEYDEHNAGMASASIGRPLANARIYILDAKRKPVPIGVAGEIYIGGDGVARGYWNKAELTAERFFVDPFRDDPSQRMYRSGDRARYRENGTIEYLGRSDCQVKVRGFRVELGEIEARLSACAGVRDAVVIARKTAVQDVRLVAYVVVREGDAALATALRAQLRRDLPDYMIPDVFIPLRELPLTPNGKLDRKALPEPGDDDSRKSQHRIAAGNRIEKTLSEIWALRLSLPVDDISVVDGFFDLGGNSLLSLMVQADINRALGADIGVSDLFQYPTIREMAEFIEGKTARTGNRDAVIASAKERQLRLRSQRRRGMAEK
jgi:acyl-coenzyme A synthetase/AMP-(fatty) acid ligase/acyl carrier protein